MIDGTLQHTIAMFSLVFSASKSYLFERKTLEVLAELSGAKWSISHLRWVTPLLQRLDPLPHLSSMDSVPKYSELVVMIWMVSNLVRHLNCARVAPGSYVCNAMLTTAKGLYIQPRFVMNPARPLSLSILILQVASFVKSLSQRSWLQWRQQTRKIQLVFVTSSSSRSTESWQLLVKQLLFEQQFFWSCWRKHYLCFMCCASSDVP